MVVKIEFIRYLCRARDTINSADLQDIIFYDNGKKVDIPDQVRDDFAMTGLNNIDFIASGFYKHHKTGKGQ